MGEWKPIGFPLWRAVDTELLYSHQRRTAGGLTCMVVGDPHPVVTNSVVDDQYALLRTETFLCQGRLRPVGRAMEAEVTCTCPECNEAMAIRADVSDFPVPHPDVGTDQILDGFAVDWGCPTCDRQFEADIVAEVSVPWVGEIDGTETCIDVRPHSDMEPIT
jgi:hypothetical protein